MKGVSCTLIALFTHCQRTVHHALAKHKRNEGQRVSDLIVSAGILLSTLYYLLMLGTL